jgi:hypothetical protein
MSLRNYGNHFYVHGLTFQTIVTLKTQILVYLLQIELLSYQVQIIVIIFCVVSVKQTGPHFLT